LLLIAVFMLGSCATRTWQSNQKQQDFNKNICSNRAADWSS